MHHASINEKSNEGNPPKWFPSHHDSKATLLKSYMACIKRVSKTWSKGCLPGSAKSSGSSKSSGPTPSSATQSIIAKYNEENKAIIKQKNQSAQKNVNSFCKILDGIIRRGKLLFLDLELWNRRYGFSEAYLNAITHI